MEKKIRNTFYRQIEAIESALDSDFISQLEIAVSCVIEALRKGHKLLIAGNGGSAADAQHFAAELVGRFKMERSALPAIALTTDTSILTCMGNDYSFDDIFKRQVEALGCNGDIFIGISTSGNSQNVYQAIQEAKKKNVLTIALTGRDGGIISREVDIALCVPVWETAYIQGVHEAAIHAMCELVEEALFTKGEN